MEAAEGILFCSWSVAQRHQRTDIEKMMNQLITVVVLDYGQKKAVGNIKGNGQVGERLGSVRTENGFKPVFHVTLAGEG